MDVIHQNINSWRRWGLIWILLSVCNAAVAANTQEYSQRRAALIKEISEDVRATSSYLGRDALDPRVMQALAKVPRHEFVPLDERDRAYLNQPLPIGYGQTISQPYIVALMTEALQLKTNSKVLEIGTGSGYQAAVLSEFTPQVFTIEIITPLAEQARERLQKLGYHTVRVRAADGYFGWPEEAPFDGIIVTCAAGHIPPPLIAQLRQGGRMVIPVGGFYEVQRLMVVTKDEDGMVRTQELLPVRFVPMTGAIQKQQ